MPGGYEPLDKLQKAHLKKLNTAQRASLSAAASQLSASTTYTQDFGPYAPPQAQVVAELNASAATTAEVVNSKAWAKYAGDLDSVTENQALTSLATLAQLLPVALKQNPGLATTYSQLVVLLGAKSAISQKAAAKKKTAKNKAAKAAAATGSATTEATAAATPPVAAGK